MSMQIITFEGFELAPQQRRLIRDGKLVRIGSRAFDILVILVANAGSIVTKEQLILSVWPSTFVDDSNLRVHMSALRRTLEKATNGRSIIENVPGRGYSFVAVIDEPGEASLNAPEQLRHGEVGRSREGRAVLDFGAIPAGGTLDGAVRSTMVLLHEGGSDGEDMSPNRATMLALLAIL